MSKFKFALCLFLFAASLAPVAGIAAGSYTGSAPVGSQSDEERAGALRVALGQVIVKLSGDASALSRPDVAKAVAHAERFMQSYSYQPNPTGSADAGKPAAKYQLVAQFDGGKVDALVRDLSAVAATAAAPGADPAASPVAAAGSYRLWISGLRSADDYARLVGSLSGNPEVRALRVELARGNGLQVRVDARGTLQSLLDSLDATRLAHATHAASPIEGVDALLDFEP
jgi:hypothetical protein